MYYKIIHDTDIVHFNMGKEGNAVSSIVYRDEDGKLHSIEFNFCAQNFKAENPNANEKCIGERNIGEYSFTFYTSGIKTKLLFKKKYVFGAKKGLFKGRRAKRFYALQTLIQETNCTTYDVS